jgi:3-dehydrosphinganine reductase
MSQLLLAATIPLVLLVGILSADIMGFAVWKSNKFQVDGKVYCSAVRRTLSC